MNGCCFQHSIAVHSHLKRCSTQMITAWGNETQMLDVEVGAESGNTADIQGAGRLHKNDDGAGVLKSGRLCDQKIL